VSIVYELRQAISGKGGFSPLIAESALHLDQARVSAAALISTHFGAASVVVGR